MQKELKAAKDAAHIAGKMIKSRIGKIRSIRYKGAINIVTDVDEKAELLITRRLSKEFPDYGFLAEESSPQNRGPCRWIIDPLDGTTNFAQGFPFFCVSIALEKKATSEAPAAMANPDADSFRSNKYPFDYKGTPFTTWILG